MWSFWVIQIDNTFKTTIYRKSRKAMQEWNLLKGGRNYLYKMGNYCTCIKKKYQKPYFGLEPWSQSRIAIYRYWTGSASQDNFGSTGFAIKRKKQSLKKASEEQNFL